MTRSDSHRLCFIKRPGTRSPPPAVIFMVWAKCKSPSQSRQSSHYTISSYQSVLSCQTALAWLTLEWTAQRSLASSTHFLGSRDTELWDTTGKFGLFVVSSGFLIAAGGLKSQHTEHSLLLSLSALLSDKPEAGLSKWGSQSVYHWEGTSQLAAWRGFSFCHHGWLLQSDKTDGGQQDAGNFTRVVTNLSRSLSTRQIYSIPHRLKHPNDLLKRHYWCQRCLEWWAVCCKPENYPRHLVREIKMTRVTWRF